MALVAYDNSSESENDYEEDANSKIVLNVAAHSPNGINKVVAGSVTSEQNISKLLTALPQPKSYFITNKVVEEDDEFLKKKEQPTECPKKPKKQPVKINISSLADFESDDDEDKELERKKPRLNYKTSELFNLLPKPKSSQLSNTSFVPNILKRKGVLKPDNPQKQEDNKTLSTEINQSNNEEDENDIDLPETFDDEMWLKVCANQTDSVTVKVPAETSMTYIEPEPLLPVESAPDVVEPYVGLDNQAFKELVGSRKKQKVNIKLIDIHEDEIRPDKSDWLKSLTDPNCEPETEVTDSVNNTCKVKNHITSLAQKALANDKELQMRWAESRHNRRQTQAKYGF